ncbi:MAG: hypothetical protein HOE90_03565 [Bacteriovoracaceae bacterium]|jgi:hypothetical protein|nr:hypothetical protein [Bacteriovoracaceae bacterium]
MDQVKILTSLIAISLTSFYFSASKTVKSVQGIFKTSDLKLPTNGFND